MSSAISASGLTKYFGNIQAVSGLDLEIKEGTVFGFLGPNGSGKTTTIRMLLGLSKPTGGSARVLGLDISEGAQTVREQCGVLLENAALYERLSLRDNLELAGRINLISRNRRTERTAELLKLMGLWERRADQAAYLSTGMKKKLAVARALYHKPKLVFLDEPSAGLDPEAAADLQNLISELVKNENLTVFLTTHNLREAEKLCHRIGVIREGKLIALDTPENLRTAAGGEQITIRAAGLDTALADRIRTMKGVKLAELHDRTLIIMNEDSGTSPAPFVRILVEAGCEVEEVRQGGADLEEAFLKMVQESREGEERYG
ncbi:MAG: ABC transporter ATP-binding protein [Spirochaetia bacterium]